MILTSFLLYDLKHDLNVKLKLLDLNVLIIRREGFHENISGKRSLQQ